MWITSSLTTVNVPTRVALGNFDGVHRGHQRVIAPVLSEVPVESGSPLPLIGSKTVLTFNPHPREFFTGQRHPLLTPLAEKAAYLDYLGVEQLVLLPFDQDLASLPPEQFVEVILVKGVQARQVSVGQDFCFGKGRSGTATDLKAIASRYNIHVEIVPLHTADGERISSSAIRQALLEGNLSRANQLLGRPYCLSGPVVQGQQLGRTLGFPTANLQPPPEKFLPRQGVYGVWVHVSSGDRQSAIPGVMNIGNRPTVGGQQQSVEVHLLDWSGDLYGQTVTVDLEYFLRSEQKFSSLDALKTQIQQDCKTARSLLARSRPAQTVPTYTSPLP